MPVTSPDSIYYADGSTPIAIETITAAMATSVQDALDALVNDARQIQTFVWANTAARNAQTGMTEGDEGYQLDNNTNYQYTGTAWVAQYSGGLVPIVPTSVAGTGVSLNAATGLITTSSSTAVNINGCFTSAFRNYRIFLESTGTAATVVVTLRASGTDSITNYDRTELLARNATVSSSTNLNGASATVIGFANTLIQADIDLSGPQVAVPTTMLTRGGVHSNPAVQNTSNGLVTNFISHRPSTSYDGITITYSAAQSGTIRVYGYN